MPPLLGLTGPFAFRDRNMLDGSARKREEPEVPPDPQSMPTQGSVLRSFRCTDA
jgi:hypothetical protein